MGPWYTTREAVKGALDSAETARNDAQVDRAIAGATDAIEGLLNRRFHPQVDTRSFDWPNRQHARMWRLWLDYDELISVTSVTSGGVVLPPTDYFLEPNRIGPPFNRLEINRATQGAFNAGATEQRSIVITGLWGYTADENPAGALAAALTDATGTTVDVTNSSAIGVGSLLRVDTERMVVTGRSSLTTGQTLQANIAASAAADMPTVADGSTFAIGEPITVGSEQMLVVDIIGNSLVVKRAWNGSRLDVHASGAVVYAHRRLTVSRGQMGTTAAVHSGGASVAVHVVPGIIGQLAIAEALVTLQRGASAYARSRVSTTGGRQIAIDTSDIDDIRTQAVTAYQRTRFGAV